MATINESQRQRISELFQRKLQIRNELEQAKSKLDTDTGEYEVAAKAVSTVDTLRFWSDSPAEVQRNALESLVQKDRNSVTTLTNSFERTSASLVETTIAVAADPKIGALKSTRDSIAAMMGPLNEVKNAVVQYDNAVAVAQANATNAAISQVGRNQPRTDVMGNTIAPNNTFNNVIGVIAVAGAVTSGMSAAGARTRALAAASQFNTAAGKIPDLHGASFNDTSDLGTVKGELGGLYAAVAAALSTANSDLNTYVEAVVAKLAVTN